MALNDDELKDQVSSLRSIDRFAYSASKSSSDIRTDEQIIARFGKKQQFNRNFSLLTVVALSSTITNSWAGLLTGFQLAIFNGGPTGFLISFPVVFVGVLMQALVVAELSSMIPLSGGQYNWVAILSPPHISNFLSYFTGWLVTIAWQAGAAGIAFLASNTIIALASTVNPTYVPQNYHTTLVLVAVIALAVVVTLFLGGLLPTIESLAFVIFVFGFFTIVIVLAYLSPKADNVQVFASFFNGGGWHNMAQSIVVGAVPIMFGFNGFDAGIHIAEEVERADHIVPRATIISVVLYFAMAYATTFLVLFCSTLEEVLTSTYAIPVLSIFQKATGSNAGTVGITSLIIIMLIFGVIGALTTASRMLWAFAREDGVPFSRHIAKVEPKSALPLVSIGITAVISAALGLISLGSVATFNALTGLTVACFYTGFLASAAMMLWQRITKPAASIPWGPFRLGVLGIPITILSIVYSIVGIIFSFWPPSAAVTIRTFNWSSVVFVGLLFVLLIWWSFRARKVYKGPKMEITSQQWLDLFR